MKSEEIERLNNMLPYERAVNILGYKNVCGGCRARSAYYHEGDILAEDTYCAFGRQLNK